MSWRHVTRRSRRRSRTCCRGSKLPKRRSTRVIPNRSRRCGRAGTRFSLFGAFGPCKKGWRQVGKTTEWVASRFRDGLVTAEYEVVHEGADLAYTVGYEIGDVAVDGAPVTRQRLRVTQIYRREDGEWRLVHRHGDFAPADQSPP